MRLSEYKPGNGIEKHLPLEDRLGYLSGLEKHQGIFIRACASTSSLDSSQDAKVNLHMSSFSTWFAVFNWLWICRPSSLW